MHSKERRSREKVCLSACTFDSCANLHVAEIMDLKKNWEADKAKVEKLKESRKFKPY